MSLRKHDKAGCIVGLTGVANGKYLVLFLQAVNHKNLYSKKLANINL